MRRRARPGGLFLTFEGIEGSGKTTQARRLSAWLSARGVSHVATREPGGTAIGAELRQVLLHGDGGLDPRAELLLMVADRCQHLSELIQPALAEGTLVLCDRYADASRAYQGAGRGLGVETVDLLHSGFGVPKPARTYLFDCPVDAAFERLTKRGERDRFEREGRAFHQRVRAAYRAFAKAEPERFCVLPAGKSEDAVFALLSKDLEGFLS